MKNRTFLRTYPMPMKFECKCGKIHYFKLDMPVIDKIEYEEAEKELITVLKKYNN